MLLFVFTLVMGLTGYLLPWDLNAFFASQVAINIAGTVPVVGAATQNFLQDGATIGTLTINRFFGIHVWLMPALLLALTGMHLAIFRHNGGAGPALDEPPKMKPGRFWPNQLFMDTVVSFAVFAIIVGLAIGSPAPLDAKADPNQTSFTPYPAWYFLALFGLLNDLPPNLELLGTVVLPGGLVLLLILLPWIDRNSTRRMSRRPILMTLTALTILGAVGLSVQAQAKIDANRAKNPTVAAATTAIASGAAANGAVANNAPGGGAGAVAPAGGSAQGTTVASAGGHGSTVYSQNCSSCHQATGGRRSRQFPAARR